MQPRFGPTDDPLREQTENELLQLIAQLYNEVDKPQEMKFVGPYGRLPTDANIDDRRGQPYVRPAWNEAERAYPEPGPAEPPEEWEGRRVGVPTKNDLNTLYKYMPQDMDASNNLLYDFFRTYPKYTRALMIHEGQNPTDSPDKYAITPGEWEHMNRNRSMQIDPPVTDAELAVFFDMGDDDEDMEAAEAANPDR